MSTVQLGAVEAKFADIIWEHAPLPSSALVKLSEEALDWKKSTTYTVLKRLCEKGIFKNEKGVVSALLSRDEFYAEQSKQFVADSFNGSLPAFLAAFMSGKNLSQAEAQEIQRMIDAYRKEGTP